MQNMELVKGVVVFHTLKQEDNVSYYKQVYSNEQMN